MQLWIVVQLQRHQLLQRLVRRHQLALSTQMRVNSVSDQLHLHVYHHQIREDTNGAPVAVPMQQILPQQTRIRGLHTHHRRVLLEQRRGRRTVVMVVQRSGEEQRDDEETRDDGVGDDASIDQCIDALEVDVELRAAYDLPGGCVGRDLEMEQGEKRGIGKASSNLPGLGETRMVELVEVGKDEWPKIGLAEMLSSRARERTECG